MKKLLAGIMAAVIVLGTGIPAVKSSADISSNSPVPFSTDADGKTAQKEFSKLKPKLKAQLKDDGYYNYNYYYDYYYSYNNYVSLSWNEIDHALLYYVFRKGPTDASYVKIGQTIFTEYYDGLASYGEYRYKVQAVSYNYDDAVVKSEQSSAAVVKYEEPKTEKKDDKVSSEGSNYAGEGDECVTTYVVHEEAPVGEGYAPDSNEIIDEEEIPTKAENPYEDYTAYDENGFKSVANYPVSTFSSDVDTASYSNIRRLINSDCSIPTDAVRIEEMLNYFEYDYEQPTGDKPFAVTTELSDCPWNKDSKLLLVGVQGKDVADEDLPASNLVYLIDVSGSMDCEDKLPLVKKSIKMLTKTMTDKDRISIIIYSGAERVVLEGAKGNQTKTVSAVLNCLEAGGCTNGEAGIQKAYEIAEKYYIKGGDNRIILATDGDLNVGISDEGELKKLVEEKRKSGVNLSVLGFGTGNIKDDNMQALADNGNGTYHYIDTAIEAQKVLVDQKKSTLYTIAKDVKFQVEFNPQYVKGYRLIGYETRALNTEDFADDTKDAGDIGVGHTVTALYEIVPVSSKMNIPSTDLKYQTNSAESTSKEWLTVKIRYKKPDGTKSLLISKSVSGSDYTAKPSENLTFAAAVAELGMILQKSEYKGTSSLAGVQKLLEQCSSISEDKYKKELLSLVKLLDEKYDYE